jgi:hypothetical protein
VVLGACLCPWFLGAFLGMGEWEMNWYSSGRQPGKRARRWGHVEMEPGALPGHGRESDERVLCCPCPVTSVSDRLPPWEGRDAARGGSRTLVFFARKKNEWMKIIGKLCRNGSNRGCWYCITLIDRSRTLFNGVRGTRYHLDHDAGFLRCPVLN